VTEDAITQIIVGESLLIRDLRALIRRVAPTHLPVFIHGPTGTGKELVAQAIHLASGRSGRFVAFNVCAIPESMFEDTLFGHVRGAFTGATRDAVGYLAEANGGTVFLDEIGALPPTMQVKLLRVIETQEFRAVGASSNRRSDFRVVSATNESLGDRMGGQFRVDLIYRLSAVRVQVPSLRDRASDIPILARHFASRFAARGSKRAELSSGALQALQEYDWPGNVRELKSVVETAIALAEHAWIARDAIVERLSACSMVAPCNGARHGERDELLALLREHRDDTAAVADRLGVDRATVYRRMQQLGVPTPKRSGVRRDGATAPPTIT
jgi:two-component system response regulator HydG